MSSVESVKFNQVENLQKADSIAKTQAAQHYVSSPIDSETRDSYVSVRPSNKGIVAQFQKSAEDYLVLNNPDKFMVKYINPEVISAAIESNPAIADILAEKGFTPVISMYNVEGQNAQHFLTTYDAAKKIGADLPRDELLILLKAAVLHDIGKSLIPEEILNKPGKLTPEEKEIVDLHARLGYEILKTTPLDPAMLGAVRMHHMSARNPQKENNEIAKMLSVADVYSALKEKRCYRPEMTDEEAKNIMTQGFNATNLEQKYVERVFT